MSIFGGSSIFSRSWAIRTVDAPVLHDLIPLPSQEPVYVPGCTHASYAAPTLAADPTNVVSADDDVFYHTYSKSKKFTFTGVSAMTQRVVTINFAENRTLDGPLDFYMACSDYSKLTGFRVRLNSGEEVGYFRKIYASTPGRVFGWTNNEFRPHQVSPFSGNAPQGAGLIASGKDWTSEHLFSGISFEFGISGKDIAGYSSAEAGAATAVTCVGYRPITGHKVTITGSENGHYDGTHTITRVDDDTFTISVAWDGDKDPRGFAAYVVDFWLDSIVLQKWRYKDDAKIKALVLDLDGAYDSAIMYIAKPLISAGKNRFFASAFVVTGSSPYPAWSDLQDLQSSGVLVGPHMREENGDKWDENTPKEELENSIPFRIRWVEANDIRGDGLVSFIFLGNASGVGPVFYAPGENAYHADSITAGSVLIDNDIKCTRGAIIDPEFKTDFTGGSSGVGASYSSSSIDSHNWIPPFGRFNYATSALSNYRAYSFADPTNGLKSFWDKLFAFGIPAYGYIHQVTAEPTENNITIQLASDIVRYIKTNDVLMLTRFDLYNLTYARPGEWYVNPANNIWTSRFDSDKRLIEEQYPNAE